MKVKIDMEGMQDLLVKLQNVEGEGKKALAQSVNVGLLMIETRCKKKVQSHASKGRTYTRGGVTHTASAGGNPPNTDTGYLVSQMYVELETDGMTGYFVSGAGYSSFLEYGTVNMAERPFVYPSFAEELPAILKEFNDIAEKYIVKGA